MCCGLGRAKRDFWLRGRGSTESFEEWATGRPWEPRSFLHPLLDQVAQNTRVLQAAPEAHVVASGRGVVWRGSRPVGLAV